MDATNNEKIEDSQDDKLDDNIIQQMKDTTITDQLNVDFEEISNDLDTVLDDDTKNSSENNTNEATETNVDTIETSITNVDTSELMDEEETVNTETTDPLICYESVSNPEIVQSDNIQNTEKSIIEQEESNKSPHEVFLPESNAKENNEQSADANKENVTSQESSKPITEITKNLANDNSIEPTTTSSDALKGMQTFMDNLLEKENNSDKSIEKTCDDQKETENKEVQEEHNHMKETETDEAVEENVTQNTLFVNSDSNSNEQTNMSEMQMETDPIASMETEELDLISSTNDTTEMMDVDNTEKSSEIKYVFINYTTNEEKCCIICSKNGKPIYACTKNADTYICSEDCFDKFKADNDGNYIIQGIRVKSFETFSKKTKAPVKEQLKQLNEHCKTCSKLVSNRAMYLTCYAFCNMDCLRKYCKETCGKCYQCPHEINDDYLGKYWFKAGLKLISFCSYSCCLANKKAVKSHCLVCKLQLQPDNKTKYCDDLCKNEHLDKDKIKECSVCHNSKPAEIEFINEGATHYFCGEPCFVAYKFVNKVDALQCEICLRYLMKTIIEENSIKNLSQIHCLCSEKCRALFQLLHGSIIKCKICGAKKNNFVAIRLGTVYYCSLYCCQKVFAKRMVCDNCKKMQNILLTDNNLNFCSFKCFNDYKLDALGSLLKNNCTTLDAQYLKYNENGTVDKIPIKEMIYVQPPDVVEQRNMSTMTKPNQSSKAVMCRPNKNTRSIQTFGNRGCDIYVPIPVPIFVPVPVHMYVDTFPVPFPVPIPVPVPILVPTTRNSPKGILKEINKVKTKIPADPLEVEILMMAALVAEDKKNDSNSGSDEDENENETENFNESNNFGEDMLQMALKMATDFEEPVDLEGEVSVSTIGPTAPPPVSFETPPVRKRGRPKSVKRNTVPVVVNQLSGSSQKPDANLCLKYTFGVNAWKQWVTTKNIDLEKSSKKPKLFKTEILQLTADELNYSLCLFVKEVRKPNGSEYAPDTIYYLCLGIQQYLYESNRIDNIFCDQFYEKFTDCLNEVCRKFSVIYNESQYIVTRVEEEHLWESKQLGAHSPLVLLNTLMFFNTKHFSLTTVDEHLQLSFSHIMKHWKRNPNLPGARNVLLRFYPPQNAQIDNKKRKMYEQQENEENPIRCPVKLYEFYLSKCPESVKTRNDVFYLLPERSCVPDSPLWYSTMALDQKSLDKMLNRVKMVKEINIALLTA